MGLRMEPELMAAMGPMAGAPKPVLTDAIQIRQVSTLSNTMTFGKIPFPERVEETNLSIPSLDGTPVPVRRFVPQSVRDSPGPHRAVVYAFSGGLVAGSVNAYRSVIARAAVGSDSQYFGVDYRLAPENPYPAGLEDVYATVKYLQENATDFDIDPTRVIVHGASAGGCLAAGVVLMARDKALKPPIAGQVLKYPMLDDQTTIPEDSPLSPYLFWSAAANDIAWESYLGQTKSERLNQEISEYAVPSRAKDVSHLPRTLIEVGGLDLFREEATQYAARLSAANVDTEFHLYPGLVHGYDGIAPDIKVTKTANENIYEFISSI